MNGLIRAKDDSQARYEDYEELLIKRDQILKEADSILVAYTREFGDLITGNFELKVECIKKKKVIAYCQRMKNKGQSIDADQMNSEIEREMLLYYTELNDLIRNNQNAKKAKPVNEFRYNKSKRIYRRLAKMLHPDINRKTMENEELKELWSRVVRAYNLSDPEELENLEVLVRKAMTDLGDEGFEIDDFNIEERIEKVERQISEIISTEPYSYREILHSVEKTEELKAKLQAEHDDYEKYLKELTEILDDMLKEGWVNVTWTIN